MNAMPEDWTERLVDGLATRGWVCLEGFLAGEEARLLAAECLAAWEADAFHQARVGRGAEMAVREDIRRDQVLWLSDESSGPAVAGYLARLDEIRGWINRHLFLGLRDFEGHFAVYPAGAFYKAHLDRHRGTMARMVTAILYLNEGWQPEDGGRLKLWTEAGRQDGPVEWIEPRMGTLVVFLSGEHWHEVEVAHRMRMSVTGWFRVDV